MAMVDSNTEYLVKQSSLEEVADAIRAKTGNIDSISFPSGFATEISNITTYKPEQEKTATPTTSIQEITPDSGKVLSKVTVKAVTSSIDSNIKASNIVSGVTILGVTGNRSPASYVHKLSINTSYNSGTSVAVGGAWNIVHGGAIVENTTSTPINTLGSFVNMLPISSDNYLPMTGSWYNETQEVSYTIQGIYRDGTSIKLLYVSGNTTKEISAGSTSDSSYWTISDTIVGQVSTVTSNAPTASQVLSGKECWANGSKITGTMSTMVAQTITPGFDDQVISTSGKYLSGDITIKGDVNLIGSNILSGKTIFGVHGSTNVVNTYLNPTANPASDSDIKSGKCAFVNGSKVTGTLPTISHASPTIVVNGTTGVITASHNISTTGIITAGTKSATKQLATQSAKTITPGTSAKTAVAKGYYTTGAVTVAGDANLIASNIKKDVSIFGVTGTYEGESTGSTGNTWYQHTIKFSAEQTSSSEFDNWTLVKDCTIILINNSSTEIQSIIELASVFEDMGITSFASSLDCGGYGGYLYDDYYGAITKIWLNNSYINIYVINGSSTTKTYGISCDPDYYSYYTTVTDTVKTLGVVSPTMVLSTDSNGKKVLTITDNL